jgi:hypothetical protein
MSIKIFDKNQVGQEARNSLRGQRQRCNGVNSTDYKYYGAKDIQVKYSSEDFYTWFKIERAKIPLDIKVNVDRIDHEKDYCFSNIRLVPKSDNVAESNSRTHNKYVVAFKLGSNKPIAIFKSIKLCAKVFGVTSSLICRHCKVKPTTLRHGSSYTFRYV